MFWKRLLPLLAAPLLLTGCLLEPGKFASTLTIHADRSFAFTYQGEVIAPDPSSMMGGGASSDSIGADEGADAKAKAEADAAAKAKKAKDAVDLEVKRRAIAEALSKEEGYRSVTYQGNGKFLVDYAISGSLSHGFVFPFNIDGQAVFPFLAVELRKDGLVRVNAPGFAASQEAPAGMGMEGMSGMGGGNSALDGTFTLTTDAEVVMHNSESGVTGGGAARTISWRATPLTKTAPIAVLRLRK